MIQKIISFKLQSLLCKELLSSHRMAPSMLPSRTPLLLSTAARSRLSQSLLCVGQINPRSLEVHSVEVHSVSRFGVISRDFHTSTVLFSSISRCPPLPAHPTKSFEALLGWVSSHGVRAFKTISSMQEVSPQGAQSILALTQSGLSQLGWFDPEKHSLPFIQNHVLYIPFYPSNRMFLFYYFLTKRFFFPHLFFLNLLIKYRV